MAEKSAKKAAPKAAKAAGKPSGSAGKAPAKQAKPATPEPKGGKGKPAAPATPAPAAPVTPPAMERLGKSGTRDILCQIEVLKDGHFFIARTITEGGAPKEYKNTVFEDLLTEMLTTLQEQLEEK